MSIDTKTKQDLIKKFARKEKDTGSPEVQVAILTTRITNLSEHFKTIKKIIIQDRGSKTCITKKENSRLC